MIVLAIIGILSAILLPVARNSIPNEDILKFKKTYNVFTNAVHELVVSDKYYFDGDLGRIMALKFMTLPHLLILAFYGIVRKENIMKVFDCLVGVI